MGTMNVKIGRERRFDFENRISSGSLEAKWMAGMLLEIGDRMLDQVEHLPVEVLNSAPVGSYLTPARMVLHVIEAEIRLLRLILPDFADPSYLSLVTQTTSKDLATRETESIDSVGILKSHMVFRGELLTNCCPDPDFLDGPIDHPIFPNRRAVLGHLIWHWSFHSGHIGAVTLEMGYEYNWTSSSKARN